jgi:hypothetical protein
MHERGGRVGAGANCLRSAVVEVPGGAGLIRGCEAAVEAMVGELERDLYRAVRTHPPVLDLVLAKLIEVEHLRRVHGECMVSAW